ncbi:MAG: O-antigen ligase family protein [Patescibacteria group bacterium]
MMHFDQLTPRLRTSLGAIALLIALPLTFVASRVPFLAAVGVLGLSAFFLFLRQPLWGALSIIFLLPFERIGSVTVGGTTIRPSQVVALVLLGAWLVRSAWRGKLSWRPMPLIWPLIIFVAVSALGLTHAENMSRGVMVFAFTVFTLLVGMLIPQVITTEHDARRALHVLSITTFLVTAFGLFQFLGDLAGLPPSLTGLRDLYTKAVLGFPRVQSTALEPLYFANFLLLPLSLLTAQLFGKVRMSGALGIPLLLLAGVAFVLTVARGGYLGFVAALLVIFALSWRYVLHPGRILAFVGTGAVVGLLALQLLSGGTDGLSSRKFTEHITNLFTGASYEERVATFETAKRAFAEQPYIGVGPGQFGPYASTNPNVTPKEGWKIVNNLPLELLAETGAIGFGAIAVAFLILFLRSMRALVAAPSPLLRALLVGGTAAIVGMLVQYQTFSILYIMHVWVAIGLLVAFQNIALKKNT